ncbi:unnamed protein product, partial [Gordionus sp. m RMFG-2023]
MRQDVIDFVKSCDLCQRYNSRFDKTSLEMQSIPIPSKVQINDQGREFVNQVSNEYHKLVGTLQRVTSAYHPQANGMDDREPETDLNDLSDTDYDCNFQRRADNMKGIFKTATKNIIKAQLKQQRDYKTRNAAKNAFYHINDKVLWNNRRADRKGGKMLQPWVGPYTIVKIVNSNVELSSSIGKILHTKANISNLKHYIEGNKDTVKKIAHCETIEGVQDQ